MEIVTKKTLTGERALYASRELKVENCLFTDGESPLKESKNIDVENSTFDWKYPLWYGENIKVINSTFTPTARAGVWYTKNVSFTDCKLNAPKTFRRCDGLTLTNVDFTDAAETLWACKNVTIKNVTANGNYLAMNAENITIENLTLNGDYCFDGGKNITVKNSVLNAKDSFWNCENVTVYDSVIKGEYLGWNSKNLTFINCTIESLQGFCYIENLKLVNCRLKNTTLAFEYTTVDAEILGKVDSIKNPYGGKIVVGEVGELIMEENRIDPQKTQIIITHTK